VLFISPIVHSVQVIANESVKVPLLTKSQLRRIFSKRQVRWSNGEEIVVFVLPSLHPLHQRFSTKQLGMFPYRLDRLWNKLTYTGLGTTPIVVDDPQTLVEAVLKTPGAIGYCAENSEVKNALVIKIKG